MVEDFLSINVDGKHISVTNFNPFVISDRPLLEIPDTGEAIGRGLVIENDTTLIKY